MFSTSPSAVIHFFSLPSKVACNSCVFENIIVAHFTEPKFFKQAWGHHFQPCCVPLFHRSTKFFKQAWSHHFQPCCVPVLQNATLIRATSGPSGMLGSNAHRHFVAFNHVRPLVRCLCSAHVQA